MVAVISHNLFQTIDRSFYDSEVRAMRSLLDGFLVSAESVARKFPNHSSIVFLSEIELFRLNRKGSRKNFVAITDSPI